MTESSETGKEREIDVEAELQSWADFHKNHPEPIVYKTRQVTITREMLETAYVGYILEPVDYKMARAKTGAEAEAVLATFSLGQRRLYAVNLFLTEVHHGGIEHYFFYSGGQVWPDAVAGLEMLGETVARDILLEATRRFPEPPSVEYTPRQEALHKLPDKVFDDLEARFYEVDDQVEASMYRYIRTHPEEFLWSGTVEDTEHPCQLGYVDGKLTWVPKKPK